MTTETSAPTAPTKRTRLIVEAATKITLPRHIKLRHDKEREEWLILAPERVFRPDDIAIEILKLCDGKTTVTDIVAVLAKQYQAPETEIETDIISMLQELADKGIVTQ